MQPIASRKAVGLETLSGLRIPGPDHPRKGEVAIPGSPKSKTNEQGLKPARLCLKLRIRPATATRTES